MYDGKIIFIVLDGLGDRITPQLGNKTPLQSAKTPNLDKMASIGITGIVDGIRPGIAPGSDSAHLSLFGYDPFEEYPGRGVFEASGFGLDLDDDEIAFRTNFGTVEEDGNTLILKDRRAGRISGPEAKGLIDSIKEIEIDGIKFKTLHTLEHRGILIMKGDGLSAEISDIDPHATNVPVLKSMPLEKATDFKAAKRTAELLNKYVLAVYRKLKDHPINKKRVKEGKLPGNIILPRGASKKFTLESFRHRWGFNPACVAVGPLYKGVARILGFKLYDPPGGTGLPNTNIKSKFETGLKALEAHDFVFIHLKGTDTASHKKEPITKRDFIERFDREFTIILDAIEKGATVLVTGDHSTPAVLGRHSGDPVPVVIAGPNIRPDKVNKFDEISCASGGLHRIRGKDLMPILLSYTDRNLEYGLHPTNKSQRYIPHTWKGLKIE